MKIIIADNQYLTQKGMLFSLKKEFPESEILIMDSITGILKITPEDKISLLIMDPETFRLNDVVELSVFSKRNPDTEILIVSNNRHSGFINKVVERGIKNLILKDCTAGDFINAVNSALSGQKYFDPDVKEALAGNDQDEKGHAELTKAETEIVKLISQGLTTKEIASKKYLSYHTIITHRKNIFRKLKIKSISELMMYAVRNGIIDTTEYYI